MQTLEITQGKHSLQRSIVNKAILEYLRICVQWIFVAAVEDWATFVFSRVHTHLLSHKNVHSYTCKLTAKAHLLNTYENFMSQQDNSKKSCVC